jgi:hypothetical protein
LALYRVFVNGNIDRSINEQTNGLIARGMDRDIDGQIIMNKKYRQIYT